MTEKMIPVIDVSPLVSGKQEAGQTVDELRAACANWGFFQVIGHGLPATLFARVFAQTRHFFALPQSAKDAVARGKNNPRGYYNRELTKNIRDMKEVFDFGHKPSPDLADDNQQNRTRDGFNQWPEDALCPEFRSTMIDYYEACGTIALKLLEGIALGLGVRPQDLTRDFRNRHTSFLRLNYYPSYDPLAAGNEPMPAVATGHMGVHHHTDAGALTLLLQDEIGGLEVCRKGEWFPLEPVTGALVVNIGDIVQVWSNDVYEAALHRVLASGDKARFSLPYFFNPAYDSEYQPLAPLTSDKSPPKYKSINWGEFREQRQLGDYADFGHEIQISDFRI